MDFDFKAVEDKWRRQWELDGIYKVTEDTTRLKYYVLDMFPYPSGAGLHVGHPLGYVASDIYARYKRLKGFNVLHPMGFDAFGLPAEQYAIETGTPPQVTTDKAIATYKEQLGKIGFSYDWSREVKTCDPSYYKWTQWIFLQLFDSWYDRAADKAAHISALKDRFAIHGCTDWKQYDKDDHEPFTAAEWNGYSEEKQQSILMHYRLVYQSYSEVNWCEALGTVLANDEVKDGKSERGGFPVIRRKMRQWFLRITEYSDRLLRGLDTIDWSDAMKDMQRNWIGRSEGALIKFNLSQTLSKGEGFNTNLTPGPSPKERGGKDIEAQQNTVLIPNPSPKEKGTNTDAAFYMTGALDSTKNIKHALENRKEPTKAEDKLWQQIRGQKLGFKFRRQHLIDSYIVDFVCLSKGLVIEVDGSVHDFTQEYDETRTEILNDIGYTVLRFTNDQVEKNVGQVLGSIRARLNSLPDNPPLHKKVDETLSSTIAEKKSADAMAVSPLSLGEGSGVRTVFVFTTRPDTIFGATFLVIAPEHELVPTLTTPDQQKEIDDYITYVKSRTDVERQQEKKVTGAFTGSYAINPFTQQPIPVYIAEYVLAGYGTGAIMAVPADDERDRKFAEKFSLPVIEVIDKSMYSGATIEDKVGKMINSDFLDGMEVKEAIKEVLEEIEDLGIGQRKVNYRQRDAGYSRQRYWGEPFPIVYQGDVPYPLPVSALPVELPAVTSYKPTGDGRSPMANNADWVNLPDGSHRETDTMPGYAGSSWYFLRYMDPNNDLAFASKDKLNYWQNVDLYLGGSEHAVGHLLYSRMWHKFLYDLGYVPTEEPFKKLVNQGMIQGVSEIMVIKGITAESSSNGYTINDVHAFQFGEDVKRFLYSADWLGDERKDEMRNEDFFSEVHVPIEFVKNNILDINGFINSDRGKQYKNDVFICRGGFWLDGKLNEFQYPINENPSQQFKTFSQVEKMSKSKYNVVNPDDVIEKYGADCFRMFEMFLGPLDQSKPWDDKGIDGVGKFIRRFWRLFYDEKGAWRVTTDTPTDAEYKALHKTLKKIAEDIERLQFNTCISQFMICLNDLNDLKCTKLAILKPLLVALAPFAPFLTEELWHALGNADSIHHAAYPPVEEKYLVESAFTYPISINGKVRVNLSFALDLSEQEVKDAVLANDVVQKWLDGAPLKKFIFVKGRIINVVV